MKSKRIIFVSILVSLMYLNSCKTEGKSETEDDSLKIEVSDSLSEYKVDTLDLTIDSTIKEEIELKNTKITKYICPQGDEEGYSEKPGDCPNCGMELINNPDYKQQKTNKK